MNPNLIPTPYIRPEPAINAASTPFERKARDKSREFEAVFLTTFVQHMYAGMKTDGPFGGGKSEEVYRSYLSREYAKSMANSGGIGLADQVYRELIQNQQTEQPS